MFHAVLYVVLALAHFAHVFEAVLPHAVAAALPWVEAACYAGLGAVALRERGQRGDDVDRGGVGAGAAETVGADGFGGRVAAV